MGFLFRRRRRRRKIRKESQPLFRRSRLKLRKKIFQKKNLVKLVIPLLLVGGVVYAVFFTDYFSVQKIIVTSTNTHIARDDIQNLLKEFKGKNLFLVNKNEIKELIQQEFPHLSGIDTYRKIPRLLEIEISNFKLVAIIKGLGKSFYLDENGILISDFEEGGVSLPIIKFIIPSKKEEKPIESGEDLKDSTLDLEFGEKLGLELADKEIQLDIEKSEFYEGQQVIEPSKLRDILVVIHEFAVEFGMGVVKTEYLVVAHEAVLITEKDSSVIFDLNGDIRTQFDKLHKVAEEIGFYEGNAIKIDLRIGTDKIFYVRKK